MDNSTRFRRKPSVTERTVDRSAVLVDPDNNRYFTINRVGVRIWGLLEQPRTATEIVAILTAEFSVDQAVCRRETEQFLELMLSRNILTAQA